MKIEATTGSIVRQTADAAVVGVFQGEASRRGDAGALDRALKGLVRRVLASGEFDAKYARTALLHASPPLKFDRAILVGLGKKEDLDVRRLVGAAVSAGRFAAAKGCESLAVAPLGRGTRGIDLTTSVRATAEGLQRSRFRVDSRKTKRDEPASTLDRVWVVGLKEGALPAARRAIEVGQAVGAGANLARELANLPGNLLSPEQLADRATAVGAEGDLEVDVLDEKRMRRLKMEAILAVGQGSRRPPRMVVMRYPGGRGARCLGFVGKGVTFDSGGISIKPSSGMEQMKYDMCGAAAVLGAMKAVARLKPKTNVVGLLGCAENLPGGAASRPGDVVTARTGTTIEIVSTDAEGRLVLADSLGYAVEQGATHLVDLATLTGACIVALGHEAAGLMTNDQRWARAVKRAADHAGERLWELPAFEEYHDDITSKIADIKNVGDGRAAGTIAGGMFLKEFVGDTPWVHLDIAGMAWATKDKSGRPYGPTGFGVATLVNLTL